MRSGRCASDNRSLSVITSRTGTCGFSARISARKRSRISFGFPLVRTCKTTFVASPLLQDEHGDATNVVLHVRTRGNPKLILDRLRAEIRALNPHVPVRDVMRSEESRVGKS